MISITKLDESRWQDYRSIRLEALKNAPLAFGSSYEDSLKNAEADWRRLIKNVIFAMDDGKPIGLIAYVQNDRTKSKHICGIYSVYVSENHRGKKIGDSLMAAAMNEIKKLGGITKVELTVNPTQKNAKKLYKKYGFKVTGRKKMELYLDGKYYDELLMEKYL
jgi:ribosomal protein S18 acetylase RimI-like enzyme